MREEGKVIAVHGNLITLIDVKKEKIQAHIKGNLKLKNFSSTSPLVVGDQVWYEKNPTGEIWIVDLIERKNCIVRKSVNLSKKSHILASNIDQAYLFYTLKNPPTTSVFIDRILVGCESFKIPAALVFTKMDQYDEQEKKIIAQIQEKYRNIGYPCFSISLEDRRKSDFNLFKEHLTKKTAIFTGVSGAGKSSLLNAIDPQYQQKIANTSTANHQSGKHTTTHAHLFEIANLEQTYLIDTPGIRGFGFYELKKEEIRLYFKEFQPYFNQCHYDNCLHLKEKNCAIKQAVEVGKIDEERYLNYLSFLEQEQEKKGYRGSF